MRMRGVGNRTAALAVVLWIGLAAPSAATTLTFDFSGQTLPDDDTGLEPDTSFSFDFDPSCSTDCTLEITLAYNESGNLTSPAQGLAGVNWDVIGSILVDEGNSVLVAPTLVGTGATTAEGDLPNTGPIAGEVVSGHWAFRDDLNTVTGLTGLAAYVLSSVGDVTPLGGTMMTGATGNAHLLPGAISSVEPNPTDGIGFAIVDPNTTADLGSGTVFAQGQTVAFLNYDGTLTGIENVNPLFGTDGVVIPEPASILLLGLGLTGLAIRSRRRG